MQRLDWRMDVAPENVVVSRKRIFVPPNPEGEDSMVTVVSPLSRSSWKWHGVWSTAHGSSQRTLHLVAHFFVFLVLWKKVWRKVTFIQLMSCFGSRSQKTKRNKTNGRHLTELRCDTNTVAEAILMFLPSCWTALINCSDGNRMCVC